jgi:hypothetical protein
MVGTDVNVPVGPVMPVGPIVPVGPVGPVNPVSPVGPVPIYRIGFHVCDIYYYIPPTINLKSHYMFQGVIRF